MRKFILLTIEGKEYEIEKTKFNVQPYGAEFFTVVENNERKFLIPWQQIKHIEEVNE